MLTSSRVGCVGHGVVLKSIWRFLVCSSCRLRATVASEARALVASQERCQHNQTAIHIPSLRAAMSSGYPSNQQPNYGDQAAFSQKQEMEYLCAGMFPSSLVKITLRNTTADRSTLQPDCGAKNAIKSREPIRCRECGHRIMYKKRTKRSMCSFVAILGSSLTFHALPLPVVQFEAR